MCVILYGFLINYFKTLINLEIEEVVHEPCSSTLDSTESQFLQIIFFWDVVGRAP